MIVEIYLKLSFTHLSVRILFPFFLEEYIRIYSPNHSRTPKSSAKNTYPNANITIGYEFNLMPKESLSDR